MQIKTRLSWYNVLGYGVGDIANNFAFAMGSLFLLSYYTDVAGIGAAAAGTMLMLVRVLDAGFDLLAGRIIDRTRTRWGRFRPYLIWGAIPLMALSVLVFSVPHDWSSDNKLIYAYVTYGLLGLAYSFVNIPYGSLATVMTQESTERARLGASRMLLATLTMVFLALVLGPQITGSSHDQQAAYTQFTMMLGVAGLALYIFCFKATKEVVERPEEQFNLKESLSTLVKNRPLIMLCFCALCVLVAAFAMIGSSMFFARYVLGDPSKFIVIVLATKLFSIIVATPLVPFLVSKLGKKSTFMIGACAGSIGYLWLFFTPVPNVLAFVAFWMGATGASIALTVLWALEADTVEYGEWATGVRIEGMTYAVFSFTRKCGQALGGSIPAFILAASGYVPNLAAQTPEVITGIRMAVALVPAGALILALVVMAFYPLTDSRFAEILQEIPKRRAARQAEAALPANVVADPT